MVDFKVEHGLVVQMPEEGQDRITVDAVGIRAMDLAVVASVVVARLLVVYPDLSSKTLRALAGELATDCHDCSWGGRCVHQPSGGCEAPDPAAPEPDPNGDLN